MYAIFTNIYPIKSVNDSQCRYIFRHHGLHLGICRVPWYLPLPGDARVWWGSWTYYFDPAEAAASGFSAINWYKLGPGKDAWWHEGGTRMGESVMRNMSEDSGQVMNIMNHVAYI